MSGYPQTPTFPIDLRGGKGIKVNRTGPTANTIVLDAVIGNDSLAQMPAGTLKANLLGGVAQPQDVTMAALAVALGLRGLAYKDAAAISDVTGLQAVLNGKQAALGFVPENTASKGQVNGYAPLGADGKVAAAFLPPSGGGSGPVSSSSITDASASGQSVLTGTPAQGRTALETAVLQNDGAVPWTTGKSIFDRTRVTVNNPSTRAWPNLPGQLGCVSAVTGAVNLPLTADQATDSSGNPTIIITAGVMGLVETFSTKQTGVGLFGMARVGVDNGRVWGLNVVTSNVLEAQLQDPSNVAHPAQINGIEIDCGWVQPANPVTGSNQLGIWIPAEFYGGRPDGAADAIRVGRYADFGWKNFLSGDHGSSDRFAQLGMMKAPGAAGASGSPGMYWISSSGGQKTANADTNSYHHTYLDITPGGDMLIRPDFFGGQGKFTVGNNDLSQTHSIHPVDGFTGARATLGSITITGNASIGANVTSNSLNTGAATANSLQINGNGTVTGNLQVTSGLYAPNGFFFQGKQVFFAPEGNNIPPGFKALIVQV